MSNTSLCVVCTVYQISNVIFEYLSNRLFILGHYGCGGVLASMSDKQHGLVDNWLRNIKDIHWNNQSLMNSVESEKQADLLVELNVKQQVYNISATSIVQGAWANGKKLKIHGLVYRLDTGKLKNLNVDVEGEQDLCNQIYKVKVSC